MENETIENQKQMIEINDQTALYEYHKQLDFLSDRVGDVAMRLSTSLYLCGRGGTGKTHLVRGMLDRICASYIYHAGHITPMGYFDLLKRHPDETLVLDDVGALFQNSIGQQMLLASLGAGYGDERARVVRYHERNKTEEAICTGGVIAISNRQMPDSEMMSAIKSRTRPIQWDPSGAQLAALMRDAVRVGWTRNGMTLTEAECLEAVNFLVEKCRVYSVLLDLRMLFDGALPDCAAEKAGLHSVGWRNHTLSTIQERVAVCSSGPPLTRAQQKARECRIADKIRSDHNSRPEQVAAWSLATGKSERAYDRRLEDLRIAE